MSSYETETGLEFGEYGELGELGEFGEATEFGEFGEFGEFHEGAEFGEFGEFHEGAEFGEFGESEMHEQFLGGILGSILGGEVASPLSEAMEVELATELLEINSEDELEQFLGGLFKKVARGVGGFINSPAGRALGGILKGVAKKALPVVGGALGSMVAPGIGTALGSKLGSMASGLFEVELESMPAEQAEFEVARRYVNMAATAARNVALAQPRPGVSPRTVARAAVAQAAKAFAPGIYRQMVRSLKATTPTAMPQYRRPGVLPRRPGVPARRPGLYPRRPRPYGWAGAQRAVVGDGFGVAPGYAAPPTYAPGYGAVPFDGEPDVGGIPGYGAVGPTPGVSYGVPGQTGRWVRRGRRIVLFGV